jgi:hypothetical protein
VVILKEKKQIALSEDIDKVLLQDFVKLVGKKTICRANWTSKSGDTIVAADPPAFCGFGNGYFYITTKNPGVSVNFLASSLVSVSMKQYTNGALTDYKITLRDGTKIDLNLF